MVPGKVLIFVAAFASVAVAFPSEKKEEKIDLPKLNVTEPLKNVTEPLKNVTEPVKNATDLVKPGSRGSVLGDLNGSVSGDGNFVDGVRNPIPPPRRGCGSSGSGVSGNGNFVNRGGVGGDVHGGISGDGNFRNRGGVGGNVIGGVSGNSNFVDVSSRRQGCF